jgi:hypothetical protein
MKRNNSQMPNQYARVKNVAKREKVINNDSDQAHGFSDEFLEESMKSSSVYVTDEDAEYKNCSSNLNAHEALSISNSLHSKCMNLFHLPEKYHIIILDGNADTCVLE